MTEPTKEQLEASDKVEKCTVGGHEQLRRDAMVGGIV